MNILMDSFEILRLFGPTVLNSSSCLSANIIHFFEEYDHTQYESMTQHFCTNIRSSNSRTEPSATLLNLLLDLYHQDNEYPTIEKVVNELYINCCSCLLFFSESYLKQFLNYFVTEFADIPKCMECHILIQFYILYQRLPSYHELGNFIDNITQIVGPPISMYQEEEKIGTATDCIEQLPRTTISSTDIKNNCCCPLCQSDFELDQQVIILKPCNHRFHLNDSDCLGTSSIIIWLSSHNDCPMCKTKIYL
jgi:hypothetical protein